VIELRASQHRQLHMRTDKEPFNDKRVRQAVALLINRDNIVKGLLEEKSDYGNDSPFAPVYPSTDKSVPQRKKNLKLAKELMAQAGFARGFRVTLTTQRLGEIPQLAQIIQRSVKAIGIDMRLNILTPTAYFAGSQEGPPRGWGTTPWLNAPVSITNWGHRAVPNVLLTSAFRSKGIWNAAHWSNKRFDTAVASFLGAIAIKDQRKYEKQMQQVLLQQTPVLIPYFYNYLGAGSKQVRGYKADAQATIYLSRTSLA
jgi:peptide/nickel transport system substrate-binding protein